MCWKFDSADGQLARLRGTSTQFGRILDGLSDNARFVNLYVHVIVRLVHHDAWSVWAAVALAVVAGLSHSWQSAAIDCIRHAFLEIATGKGSELELPEDLKGTTEDVEDTEGTGKISSVSSMSAVVHSTRLARIGQSAYRAYVRRQQWLCPVTIRLVRRLRANGATQQVRGAYRDSEVGVVKQCAWLGQNIRFPLVGIPGTLGVISAFLWLTIIPLNLILVALLMTHERRAGRILALVGGDRVAESGNSLEAASR